MKKQTIIKMFAGILIGILVTLFLTLNYWGYEVWKVTLSVALGIIVGMFIADIKVTMQILFAVTKNACHFTQDCYERVCDINLDPRKVSKKIWVKRYLIASLTIKFLFIMFIYILFMSMGVLSSDKSGFLLGYIYILSVSIILLGSLLFKSGLDTDIRNIRIDKRIWKKENLFYIDWRINDKKRWLSFKVLYFLARDKGILFTEWKSFLVFLSAFVISLIWIWITIKKIIVVGGFAILSGIAFITLSIILLPFWFLRELWNHKKLLVVALSIVAGGIVGTIYKSYLYGVLTGFAIATVSLILERRFAQADLFFYRKIFTNKKLWQKVIAI